MLIAEALEGAYPKAGNVSPLNEGPFKYLDLLVEAWRLKRVCEMTLPLGKRYYTFLTSQRVTALAGFAILSIPLFDCLSRGLKMGRCGRDIVRGSSPEDAYWYLKALRDSGLSHLRRVEGRDYPNVERPEEVFEKGWNLEYVFKRVADTISLEIIRGYPLSTEGAHYLLENGIERIRELQRIILSKSIDDLVARKWGLRVAYELTLAAREGLHEKFIEEKGLNPGTTADIIGVSVLIALSELLRRRELW
ncbi:hypothetical protein IPA_03925 [Ignicoccus pacificus DSM 13166]|uniref:Triphosphoribosyl-dephospho-CoA synthase n=1 Tax=Ignicoccus pacificus DSM 13166 TaxID=940294 RepID=A0A977PK20_9CREN|nr:hypothetical protein IPA_03925 [Ignicoccus pacificus DSM 13166]